MNQNRYIDVAINNPDKTSKLLLSHSNFSFTMNLGSFKNAFYESETILLLIYDKGEIRIEISLEEISSTIKQS